ncbi:MAG: NAD(+) synthase [Deltaproteobacteria bacterium]|jgi:NAD+ synthase (glutamine-hydrolysing)|nr:NAD(+) synthase [Deltaproteobacteria bacterium]
MNVAMLQLNLVTGDICGNAARIAKAARAAASSGADLCITPDHALCGVGPQHMLTVDGFVEACRNALRALAEELADGPPVLTGSPIPAFMPDDGRFCHAAVLLKDGKFVLAANTALDFDDQTGLSPAADQGLCCGMVTLHGWRIGIYSCDERRLDALFEQILRTNAHSPLKTLLMRGIDALVHLGATPFTLGMHELREQRLAHVASRNHLHLFSSNLVGGNGGDVYHGQSLGFGPTGVLLGRGRIFEEDCVMIRTATGEGTRRPACSSREEQSWGALCLGLRDYVRKSGFEGVLLGLSGGLDSAVTAAIAVDALGGENVLGVLLPSPWTSEESTRYAFELADNLGIERMELPIAPLMQAYAATLAPAFAASAKPVHAGRDTVEENIQSRIRGNLLMALANKHGLLLLNTSNKSEAAVGYSTLYGDAAGALAVIGDIHKSGVYKLARWFNESRGKAVIPEGVIGRAPSAELRPGQLDVDSLPPYDVLDPLLARITGEDALPELQADDGEQPDPALQDEVYGKVRAAEFKRRQFPPALRVSRRAFGRDWRLPLVSRYGIPEK